MLEALGSVERAVGENLNLPILKNFLVRALKGRIVFISTNLEIAVECEMSGKIIEDGEVTIPFSIFHSVVRNLAAERITLEKEKDKILISSDNYEGIIQDEDPKEFPIIPHISNTGQCIKIKSDDLREIFKNVLVSVQYSTLRPEISGVFMSQSNNLLTFAGTDSFRLTEVWLGVGGYTSTLEDFSLTIPLRTAQEVAKMFSGSEEISIFADSNQILFAGDHEKIISRIIDGAFPDYQNIIPKDFKTEVVVQREEFLSAVRLVSAFSGKASDIRLKSGDNGKFLEIFSSDAALGESRYKIPAKITGDDFMVIFNWRYLIDGLKICRDDEVVFGVNSSDKPAELRGSREQNLLYVVMPIRG